MRRHRQKSIDYTNIEKTGLAAEGYTARGSRELDGYGMTHKKLAGPNDTRHELHGELSGQHAF